MSNIKQTSEFSLNQIAFMYCENEAMYGGACGIEGCPTCNGDPDFNYWQTPKKKIQKNSKKKIKEV